MIGENWVDDLVAECAHVETPESWLWWSFITCISAAAGNNYFLRTLKGDLIYKPNVYVMLLGESGLGKGFPINRAKLLVQKAEITRVIAGRSSIQAIVKELATARTREGKAPIADSRGFIVNGELSTAIIQDPDSLTILTDLYDGHYNPEWVNLLKGDGAEKLKDPYITALFGSSPAHFYDSVPQANIEGGYIGRNLVIYEEKRSKDVDLLDNIDDDSLSAEQEKLETHVIPTYVPHLQQIAGKKGQIIPSAEARKFFNEWRREWRIGQTKTSDRTGFLNRVPDHVLKIAMLLSLARYKNPSLTIDEFDIEDAIKRVTSLVYANKRTTEGSGINPLAVQTHAVVNELLAAQNQELHRKELLKKVYGTADAATLDKVLDNLLEMGWVAREKYVAGKATDWIIKLSGEPLERYKKFLDKNKNGSGR